ncbi:NlpC/P60 family protein [Pseudovibrio exalbescens]|uniref:C40 family peptidase n=1 Tax=Pseudovibrio exalbescens TaxID=197461 RepID=UPI002366F96F|nr:NlpC/P60 family protein [Pseudovibrio exalbescens]MDD7910098.1 NlpC/P60 family protein [Pseudovibrio exalbescens]
MTQFDRRLHPVRPDLAARAYEGKCSADRFVDGRRMAIAADIVPLRGEPSEFAGIDTELLYGETFTVFDERDGWSWGQNDTDGYVGWLPTETLGAHFTPTHRVKVLRTYRYPEAELKRPPKGLISLGAMVHVVCHAETRGLTYAELADGSFVVAEHLAPLEHRVEDWVTTAEAMLGTPYLWGGRSTMGTDCSGLVQLSTQSGGYQLRRDADMQEATAGEALSLEDGLPALQRGDLLFWKGHVGLMSDPETLLHANGYTMTVAYEPLNVALERIAKNEFGALTAVRRLQAPAT